MTSEFCAGFASRVRAVCGYPHEIAVYEKLVSTNDEAAARARAGAPEGTCVIALSQSGGRGRYGRSFFSPGKTGLYMSVVLRPRDGLQNITCAAAVAVARALESLSGEKAYIKWVNDIYMRGKKVCGILAEGGIRGDDGYVVLGAGINAYPPEHGFPDEIKERAGAVFTDTACPRELLAGRVLGELIKIFTSDKNDFYAEYIDRSFLVGKRVRVITVNGEYYATVTGFSDALGLIVSADDGNERVLDSGEVSIIPE